MRSNLYSVCPVCCGQAGFQNEEHKFGDIQYTLEKCNQCGLYFWWPLLFPNAEYYESHESYIPQHLDITLIQGNHRRFLNKYKNQPGALLDVGCANGSFIKEAEKFGFDVYGIDIDSNSIKASKERGLKDTYHMAIDEFYSYAKDRGLQFDYVTIFEVIEHQSRPVDFLNLVKKVMKPGGVVYGSVPNRNRLSWLLREKGKRYENVDYPPHHFTLWDLYSLEQYFKAAGLTGEFFIIDEWRRYNVIINKTGIYEWIKKIKKRLLGIEKAELPLEGNLSKVSMKFKLLSVVRSSYDFAVSLIFSPYWVIASLTNNGVRIIFDVKETKEG